MARSRASRSRGDSANPNTVLVVFLVLFILTTLGLGVWVYSMFGQRHRAEEAKREANETLDKAKKREEWAKLQLQEMWAMLGEQDDKAPEYEEWKAARAEVIEPGAEPKFKEGGKFAAYEKERKAFEESVKAAYKDLGWNPGTHTYN